MSVIKWNTPGAFTTMLSTELNNLANGGTSVVGPAFDNTSLLALFGDFQIDVTFGVAPTVNSPLSLLLVPAPDGATYNTAGYSGFNIGGVLVAAAITQQLYTIRGIPLPPTLFKMQLFNQSTQPFPATGSTVKMLPYSYQSV